MKSKRCQKFNMINVNLVHTAKHDFECKIVTTCKTGYVINLVNIKTCWVVWLCVIIVMGFYLD